jgi:DNA mismatch endonuclease (patch repair protein)
MTDVHAPAVRSRNMAAIRSKDTRPELALRRLLHERGLRYRLHCSELPGKPDLVFPRFRAVVFVHGCLFHGHECPAFRWPQTRAAWWRAKIEGNRARDQRNREALARSGWRVLVVWECALRGPRRIAGDVLASRVARWLMSNRARAEFKGRERR